MVRNDLNPDLQSGHRLVGAEVEAFGPGGEEAECDGWRSFVTLACGARFAALRITTGEALRGRAVYGPGVWLVIYLRGQSRTVIDGGASLSAAPETWRLIVADRPIVTESYIARRERFDAILITTPLGWAAQFGARAGAAADDPVASLLTPTRGGVATFRGALDPVSHRAALDLLRPVGDTVGERIRLEADVLALLLRICRAAAPRSMASPAASEARALELARSILVGGARPPTIAELSTQVGLGATQLKVKFKARYGMTIADYAAAERMALARRRLADARSVAEVAHGLGFTPAGFSSAFRRHFGVAPSTLLRR